MSGIELAKESVAGLNKTIDDDYTVVRSIGSGSFGEALLVKSKATQKRAVAKVIKLVGMSEKDIHHSVMEVRVMQKLKHPNIVGYIDSFLTKENDLYIIMEYCNGGDLWELIKDCETRGELLPEERIISYFVQLCLGLDFLHKHHILHRDLKARNVFLTSAGLVKIGDFGLSTMLDSTLEKAKTVCGTPYYFSPELCKQVPYTNKSDVWSLGCILYEMCALKHPYLAKNLVELMAVIEKGSVPTIPGSFSKDLQRLLSSIFTQDSTQRPSMGHLAADPFLRDHFARVATKLKTNPPVVPKSVSRPAAAGAVAVKKVGIPEIDGAFAKAMAGAKAGGGGDVVEAPDMDQADTDAQVNEVIKALNESIKATAPTSNVPWS